MSIQTQSNSIIIVLLTVVCIFNGKVEVKSDGDMESYWQDITGKENVTFDLLHNTHKKQARLPSRAGITQQLRFCLSLDPVWITSVQLVAWFCLVLAFQSE